MAEGDSTLVTPTMRDLKRFAVGMAVYTAIIVGTIAIGKFIASLV